MAVIDFNEFEALLPQHKGGLTIEHNPHHGVYESASQWIAGADHCDWESEDAKQAAIATDSIWVLHWYPNTPVGFNAVAAPTLAELMRFALPGEDGE